MTTFTLGTYQTADARRPFTEWIEGLRDIKGRAKIQARLARVTVGNFGDAEPVGDGVMELKIDWGPGYRVYYARIDRTVILLLWGGNKGTQQRDIQRAKDYFNDYQERIQKKRKKGRA